MLSIETLPVDPAASARCVGLRYVTDDIPGFRREKFNGDFRYLDTRGRVTRDQDTLDRIKSLVIPPAWTDVWICPDENGHLQATGRDARRRKQHRYHPRWREVRDETKYTQMIEFARALPAIRQRVEEDLSLPGLPRDKVLATVVRLLETSLIRVGNEEYARENNSYGLTTMKNRHVDVSGSRLHFHFRGKSGKDHQVDIHDRRIAKIVRACQDIPGHELFQYIDEDGERRKVESDDVNAYLREISGRDFTAKFFRTWAGTVFAALALCDLAEFTSKSQAKKNVTQAVKSVAARLGNTPAVCRKCYVHPAIFDSYVQRSLNAALQRRHTRRMTNSPHELNADEAAVLELLENCLAAETAAAHRGNGSSRCDSAAR